MNQESEATYSRFAVEKKATRRKMADTPLLLPKVGRITCPRHCGWYRDYTEGMGWGEREVAHPLYGVISEKMLVQMDMTNHNCVDSANARLRASIRRRNAKVRVASTE